MQVKLLLSVENKKKSEKQKFFGKFKKTLAKQPSL